MKTRPSQKKAVITHVKKYGYVNYMRRVRVMRHAKSDLRGQLAELKEMIGNA